MRCDPTGQAWYLNGIYYDYDNTTADYYQKQQGLPPVAYLNAVNAQFVHYNPSCWSTGSTSATENSTWIQQENSETFYGYHFTLDTPLRRVGWCAINTAIVAGEVIVLVGAGAGGAVSAAASATTAGASLAAAGVFMTVIFETGLTLATDGGNLITSLGYTVTGTDFTVSVGIPKSNDLETIASYLIMGPVSVG